MGTNTFDKRVGIVGKSSNIDGNGRNMVSKASNVELDVEEVNDG